jgi:hypothetical protein
MSLSENREKHVITPSDDFFEPKFSLVQRIALVGQRMVVVDTQNVRAVLGVGGLNLTVKQKPLLVWKHLDLFTFDGRVRLTFDPDGNAALYGFLKDDCVRAWGLPYQMDLEPPHDLSSECSSILGDGAAGSSQAVRGIDWDRPIAYAVGRGCNDLAGGAWAETGFRQGLGHP